MTLDGLLDDESSFRWTLMSTVFGIFDSTFFEIILGLWLPSINDDILLRMGWLYRTLGSALLRVDAVDLGLKLLVL